ncbi:MAG: hypothetical protein FJW39_02330 [Acidobacteria bacterium]|nr:hypothetical protein [Acidobacteriota bacterium]
MPEIAALLTHARFERERIPGIPAELAPADVAAAYRMQGEVVDAWRVRLDSELAGYKIACTNAIAQKHLGTDSPFYGRLFEKTVWRSPAREEPYSREEVEAAVGAVMPAIELVDSRYTEWTTVGLRSLIVDNACHAGWVHGPVTEDWRGIDLAGHHVSLSINGALKSTGTGAAVLGHPLIALTWLANRLREGGSGLGAGDRITTGVCTDIAYGFPGDQVVADFGVLGAVEIRF